MGLLLITTLKSPDKKLMDTVVERYQEEEVKAETKKSEPVKTEISAKEAESKQKETASSKTETPVKKSENTNSSSKKIETPQVKEEKKSQEKVEKVEAAKKTESAVSKKEEVKAVTKPETNAEKKSKYNFPPAKNNAQLIFVFDDGGQKLEWLSPFLKLPFPITVAVLPQLAYSKQSAAQIRASGNELILHQPMQAVNATVNPGPGALKPEMSENEIKSILFNNITEIGPIAGMNNHEGSAITADAEKMALVMQFCSQEGIYFLDSRTNVETKVPYVAKELGYSYYERNIFLDNEKTEANALKELKKGLDLANKNGSVIMIGHIWSADFLPAFLQDVYPELKEKGYTFSTVSKSRAKKN
jgi:polysaccharide deacetylase 2 family uncharacterized protein YibQ